MTKNKRVQNLYEEIIETINRVEPTLSDINTVEDQFEIYEIIRQSLLKVADCNEEFKDLLERGM